MKNSAAEIDQFFENSDLTPEQTRDIVKNGLKGADFGEFYQEITFSEGFTIKSGKYVDFSSGNSGGGFGFRFGQGERVGYVYSNVFNRAALTEAVRTARQVMSGHTGSVSLGVHGRTAQQLYPQINPVTQLGIEDKIRKIDEIENWASGLDSRIRSVSISLQSSAKAVHIITADGQSLVDMRPKTAMGIGIQLTKQGNETETGSRSLGGPVDYSAVFNTVAWQTAVREALQQAEELIIAADAPAGTMDVVMNHGWPAVILHEAVGHGLEGDFNRKGISVYSGKIGQQVAAPGVTVIDQGDIPDYRGSLHFDDEGTPTQKNVLIENGILKGYMQDRQNARLMTADLTGNGRRQSYAHAPMPRMTNTFFANGAYDHNEIIESVRDGLYIKDMSGGQVDITSGNFNMNATLAYRIRDGALCEPVKGASLVGTGLQVIQSIDMIGNDLKVENTAGVCGKDGQSVTVGCGQPTIRVSNIAIGGHGKR